MKRSASGSLLDERGPERVVDLHRLVLRPDGYENNDGGQGDVTLDVAAMRVDVDHEENYTETRSSHEEYDV